MQQLADGRYRKWERPLATLLLINYFYSLFHFLKYLFYGESSYEMALLLTVLIPVLLVLLFFDVYARWLQDMKSTRPVAVPNIKAAIAWSSLPLVLLLPLIILESLILNVLLKVDWYDLFDGVVDRMVLVRFIYDKAWPTLEVLFWSIHCFLYLYSIYLFVRCLAPEYGVSRGTFFVQCIVKIMTVLLSLLWLWLFWSLLIGDFNAFLVRTLSLVYMMFRFFSTPMSFFYFLGGLFDG